MLEPNETIDDLLGAFRVFRESKADALKNIDQLPEFIPDRSTDSFEDLLKRCQHQSAMLGKCRNVLIEPRNIFEVDKIAVDKLEEWKICFADIHAWTASYFNGIEAMFGETCVVRKKHSAMLEFFVNVLEKLIAHILAANSINVGIKEYLSIEFGAQEGRYLQDLAWLKSDIDEKAIHNMLVFNAGSMFTGFRAPVKFTQLVDRIRNEISDLQLKLQSFNSDA